MNPWTHPTSAYPTQLSLPPTRNQSQGATVPSTDRTAGQLDFSALKTSELWVALITFLYLDFLDATSTMYAMARLVSARVRLVFARNGWRVRCFSGMFVHLVQFCRWLAGWLAGLLIHPRQSCSEQ
jgi:hypothetical protein